MDAEPLTQALYDELKANGVTSFTLKFSGGDDEGYLTVDLGQQNHELEQKVEKWAWKNYEYSGAGDGSGDYGDNITYDLENNTTSSVYWQHEAVYGEPESGEIEIK